MSPHRKRFSLAGRVSVLVDREIARVLSPELTELQSQVLDLLGVSASAYLDKTRNGLPPCGEIRSIDKFNVWKMGRIDDLDIRRQRWHPGRGSPKAACHQ
jgi:hypothetical protein